MTAHVVILAMRCPKCGTRPILHEPGEHLARWRIICSDFTAINANTNEQAITRWNETVWEYMS